MCFQCSELDVCFPRRLFKPFHRYVYYNYAIYRCKCSECTQEKSKYGIKNWTFCKYHSSLRSRHVNVRLLCAALVVFVYVRLWMNFRRIMLRTFQQTVINERPCTGSAALSVRLMPCERNAYVCGLTSRMDSNTNVFSGHETRKTRDVQIDVSVLNTISFSSSRYHHHRLISVYFLWIPDLTI